MGPATVGVLAGIMALAWVMIAPAMSPPSLWLDDAWPALVVRASSLPEAMRTTVTAPGFTVLLTVWLKLVGFSELAAQALPLAFGLAVAPVVHLAGRRLWTSRSAPLVAAAIAALSPLTLSYAPRVKPYTLDVLLCAVLVAVAATTLTAPRGTSARWRLVAVGLGAIAMSAAVVGMATAAVLTTTLQAMRRRPTGNSRWSMAITGPALGFAGASLLWYAAVLRGSMNDAMRTYWSPHFLDLSSLPSMTWHGVERALRLLTPLPVHLAVVGALAGIVGLVWQRISRRPSVRETAGGHAVAKEAQDLLLACILVPWGISFVLALAHQAPWGGGRTDSGLVVSTALALAAVVTIPWPGPAIVRRLVSLAALGVLVTAIVTSPRASYPIEDLRTVATMLEGQRQPGDATVVYSAARWGYALYSTDPVHLVSDDADASGFVPVPDSSDTTFLRPVGSGGEDDLALALAEVPGRVWLVIAHERTSMVDQLAQQMARQGYRREDTGVSARGARADLWVREGLRAGPA